MSNATPNANNKMSVFPFRIKSHGVLIFDTVSPMPEFLKDRASCVLANDEKSYNVFDIFMKKQTINETEVQGVGRRLRVAMERIAGNIYNTSNIVAIGSDKLPKNTNELAGLLKPIINSVESAFPFGADFLLASDKVEVEIETVATPDAPAVVGRADVPGTKTEFFFSDFISVDGWVNVVNGEETIINLNTAIKMNTPTTSVAATLNSLIEIQKKLTGSDKRPVIFHNIVLFRSETMTDEDAKFMAALIGNGAKIFTKNTPVKSLPQWMPSSATAIEEKVFNAIHGSNHADIAIAF